MRKLLLLLLTAFALIVPTAASATITADGENTITRLSIDVQLQSDGSALITEERVINPVEATEHYIPIKDLMGSEITDFSVSEDGQELTNIGEWDSDRTIEEKAGQYGILHTSDGMELCWGIGHLGESTFEVTYRVTNFVRNLADDGQAVYWEFISSGHDYIGTTEIVIRNADGSALGDVKFWGFGYSGSTEIKEAELRTVNSVLPSDDYVTLLAVFPTTIYGSTDSLDYTTASIEEKAKEGSDWDGETGGYMDEHDDPLRSSSAFPFFKLMAIPALITGFVSILIFGLPLFFLIKGMQSSAKAAPTAFGFKPSKSDAYWRDIPKAHFSDLASLTKNGTSDWMAAYFLTWIRQDFMKPMTYEEKFLFFKREAKALALNPKATDSAMSHHEARLWQLVRTAAGENAVLEENEFNSYFKKKPSRYTDWRNDVAEHSTRYLINNGLITHEIRGKIFTRHKFEITPAGQQLLDQVEGLKRYLLDYSLISQREPVNVHLWQDYLVWAAFLGIADEVEEQFNLIDPAYLNSTGYSPATVSAISAISHSAQSGYTSGTSSSSSGGGGFSSSSGGGGGSMGGGGGGSR